MKDGNRISEIGKIGTDKVEKYYEYTVENRLAAVYDKDELLVAMAYDGDGNRVFQLNYNLHTDEDWKGNSGNGNGNNKDNKGSGNNGKGSSNNGKGNSKSTGTDDAGYGNATNAEEHNSQNQSGILFPIDEEVSETEQSLIDQIKTTGKEKNYELIEYLNDVNREYVEVLVEQNINGKTDTSYVYGVNRLSLDRFDGSTGYYLYDPRGSVVGITNEEGQIYQSYRYSATGEITFGAPQYENEYTYNGESYNPNIESQYLRARYYNVVTATFLTEDSYLGNINEPLTLNRYNYCVSSYLNYKDPSGNIPIIPTGIIPPHDSAKKIGAIIEESIANGETDLSAWDVLVRYATNEVADEHAMRQELEDTLAEQILNSSGGKMYLNALGDSKSVLASPFIVRNLIKGNLSTGELEDTIVANYHAGLGGYLYELGRNIIDPEYLLSNGILGIEGTKNVVTDLYEDYQKAGSFGAFAKKELIETGKNLLNAGSAFWSGEYDAQIARGMGATTLEVIITYKIAKYVKDKNCTVDTQKSTSVLGDGKTSYGKSSGNVYQSGRTTDFYVTPRGDAIPADRIQFENNLSMMDEVGGKYIGDTTNNGPVRVRIEEPHPLDDNFNGDWDSDHFVDHIHVEHRKNVTSGQWGKGWGNKATIPLDWIKGGE